MIAAAPGETAVRGQIALIAVFKGEHRRRLEFLDFRHLVAERLVDLRAQLRLKSEVKGGDNVLLVGINRVIPAQRMEIAPAQAVDAGVVAGVFSASQCSSVRNFSAAALPERRVANFSPARRWSCNRRTLPHPRHCRRPAPHRADCSRFGTCRRFLQKFGPAGHGTQPISSPAIFIRIQPHKLEGIADHRDVAGGEAPSYSPPPRRRRHPA